MRLSVLDQSPIREGGSAAQAIRETIKLAAATDQMGYHRYWLAEHHNSRALASAAPEVLIPQVAAHTERIRVGSGGVMLTHYSPLKVAEQFRTLEALFPGRIDLGLGRAAGTGQQTTDALRTGPGSLGLEHYPDQVADLIAYLADRIPQGHPFEGVRAMPAGDSMPEVWLLGSSTDSAILAGELGLAFSYAHFINPEAGERATQLYRRRFEPSPWLDEPRISVGVSALCATTEEEAIRLSWSRYCWRFGHGAVPSVETALEFEYSKPELEYIEFSRRQSAIGDPSRVHEKLTTPAGSLAAEELVLVTITYDFADGVRSYELVAEAFGLDDLTDGETADEENAVS
jgi:luciferase family oxidoreductase group 1